MPSTEAPEEHASGEATEPGHLFTAILAEAASAHDRAYTIGDIAERLGRPAEAVAACVALHLAASRNIVDPRKLIVPRPHDRVSDDMLGIVRL